MSAVRVLIADDQALIRAGLAMVLGAQPDIEVVGEAQDGIEAVALASAHRPDVVLMDVQMPRMDGLEATKELVTSGSGIRVLVLTTFDLDAYAFGAIEAGASGFLLKDSDADDIVAAIRAVAAGDAVLAPRVTSELLRRFGALSRAAEEPARRARDEDRRAAAARLQVLTDREREVFDALVQGLSNAEIAERLWLSESTVKTHVGRVLQKLGMRDRVLAVVFAFRNGLTDQG
ncbi:response regulator [Microbacterium azadirachtae]|jgi:DNA-binding NarL/FixJ family response regulator|uniref:DNA-binding response regulator, NarL/FixJ family, contains REC and HTH domains n=1 Tax=Microbacterium azadirachtae TaxID=582680 RepID=A0A1I6HVV7_9MICO|nr:response regulator transcription factor [Microbacterium azadirachtae]SDL73839.1 DNA-binding response regulator, NarL/FixJ family, contains REC and HTH domains [Microbacterium azadirachtae]SEG03128.1 DNA-binding response regulator, NarL/FixJ family, contains REC and HTH domains [Microbacterium azadirachtae]SEG05856.1 DNA-binding response regulator, NarL/FixJ family, contains REC and HTH domains [Microbacterium azadirachtae]SFR58575.1 DNA-binding response regulator, NarL/FixJ family, contains 